MDVRRPSFFRFFLLTRPALSDYPSTHSVLDGAAAVMMCRFFGTDQLSFTRRR